MPILRPVPANRFRQQPWRNGRGRTTELAAGPDPDHWRWRISLARIDTDGTFSVLPGVHRQLAPLDGRLELRFEDGEYMSAQRHQVLTFDGNRHVACHLPDGPGRDLNLMLHDEVEGELLLRPLVGTMHLPSRTGCWFILQLSGHAEIRSGRESRPLEAGHALWVHPRDGVQTLLDGAGEIALVHLANPD